MPDSSVGRFLTPDSALPHAMTRGSTTARESACAADKASFPNDLHEGALSAAAVEFTVKNLLPGPEVQSAPGDRHHHFPPHDLPLHVGIGVVFARAIVLVL